MEFRIIRARECFPDAHPSPGNRGAVRPPRRRAIRTGATAAGFNRRSPVQRVCPTPRLGRGSRGRAFRMSGSWTAVTSVYSPGAAPGRRFSRPRAPQRANQRRRSIFRSFFRPRPAKALSQRTEKAGLYIARSRRIPARPKCQCLTCAASPRTETLNRDHPPARTPPYVIITLRVMDWSHAERDDYFECSIRITHQHERRPEVGVVIRPHGT